MTQAPSQEMIGNRTDLRAPSASGAQSAAAGPAPRTASACAAADVASQAATDTRAEAGSPLPSETLKEDRRTRAKATAQVFLGGASYGAMATTYKLSYAAGFTSNQVVAGQGWTSCFLFAVAFLIGMARGKRWRPIGAKCTLKLLGLGGLTCTTSILYCYAMSVLPVPVALTLLFQFTWIGTVIQVVMTRKPPALAQVIAAGVILVGTVFASGVYQTGIIGYDPMGLACGFCAAISCALFVTLSGKVAAPCSTEQRGFIVCAGVVVGSHLVCPDFIVSGVLLQGYAPYAFVCGLFGMLVPVMLFGLGAPHLSAGMSTIMTSAELPAGLLVAMVVLGTPISPVEWLGVATILAGVCIAQIRGKKHAGGSVE